MRCQSVRSIAAALSVAVVMLLTGCTTTASGSSDGSANNAPAPAPQAAPAAQLNAGEQWDNEGCLEQYVAQGSTIVSSSETALCRIADTANQANGSFYLLVEKGQSASEWVMDYGTDNNGYTYWMFPNGNWFRQNGDGPEQLLVQDTQGNKSYEDVSTWETGSQDAFLKIVEFGIIENAGLQKIVQYENETSAAVAQNNATQAQLAQAQQQLQQQQAQNQQLQQQLQSAQQQQQSTSSSTDARQQAEAIVEQARARMLQIETQPPCDFSSNGCA